MHLRKLLISLVLMAVLLAACVPVTGAPGASSTNPVPSNVPPTVPANTPTTVPPTPQDAPIQPPAAAMAAQQALAKKLGIAADGIRITKIEEVEWPDGCLGVNVPGMMCTQVITPGFRVTLEANGKTYEYHTNQSGSAVLSTEEALGGSVSETQAIEALKKLLASEQNMDPSQINLVKSERAEFPNSCLGYSGKDEVCSQVITPGIRVILNAGGVDYEYHLDANATYARMPGGSLLDLTIGSQPGTKGVQPALVYRSKGNSCRELRVSTVGGLEYGDCGSSSMTQQPFPMPARARELGILRDTYASFTADTQTGSVEFTGQGKTIPTEAEKRSVVAWAEMVLQETEGRSSAAQGMALSWSRTGGIAGFCDDLVVYQTGFAMATNCKIAKPPASQRLSAGQINALNAYRDQYQRFELNSGNSGADAMAQNLIFEGQGQQAPGDAQKAEIEKFAADLFLELTQQR